MEQVKIEDDYDAEEIDLANRINALVTSSDEIADMIEDGRSLIELGIISQERLDQTIKDLNESRSLVGILSRRLEKKVNRRRAED